MNGGRVPSSTGPRRSDQRSWGERERNRENTPPQHLDAPIVRAATEELKQPGAGAMVPQIPFPGPDAKAWDNAPRRARRSVMELAGLEPAT
jgi:hypothetical protein